MFTAETLRKAVRSFSPDILHAFHAVRCGTLVAQIGQELQLPYLITITGTEIYRGDEQAFSVAEGLTLKNAAALVAFHEVIGKRVKTALPALAGRLKIIPQGVEIPDNSSPDSLPDSPFIFLLPAGIRPVKNILFSFRPLEQLWHRYPQIRLLIAGPVLDKGYFEEVMAALVRYPFAEWLGEVSPAGMPALYRSAHVVLNTSLSEGGMANSLLEAMAYGRPVLVSAVEGNRSLVSDGENGFLFTSEEEFIDKAERLLLDKRIRETVAASGRSFVLEHCSADREAKNYLELYMNILAQTKGV